MVLVAANQDTVFTRLAKVMDQPELATDERFATHSARGANAALLDDMIAEWTSTIDADDLLHALAEGAVPAGRIFRAKDMLADPHFAAREAIVRIAHPEFGEVPMQNVAPRLTASPGRVRRTGPDLGEHTDEVLREVAGLDDAAIEALRSDGVI
jgi:formyl-CoA transferase